MSSSEVVNLADEQFADWDSITWWSRFTYVLRCGLSNGPT